MFKFPFLLTAFLLVGAPGGTVSAQDGISSLPSVISCMFSGVTEVYLSVASTGGTLAQVMGPMGPMVQRGRNELNDRNVILQARHRHGQYEFLDDLDRVRISIVPSTDGAAYRRIADMSLPERSPSHTSSLRLRFPPGARAKLHLTFEQRHALGLTNATYLVGVCEGV